MATIRPNDIAMSTTPTLATRNLSSPSPALRPERKITAPRIDIEPLYTAIKSAISDADWTIYKSSISQFLLGNLNQEELSSKLDRILSTPALEHAHNQFVLGIYANSFRDAPEPGTASWADDKVVGKSGGAGGKAGHNQGDETEKRLKHEVMQLPRRERKRLKTLQENPYDAFANGMAEYHDMRRIRQPDTGPASAGGFQKTNWDIEIRKRYTAPLFTESHEFPDAQSIAQRMLPICYENGLPSGHAADCPAFMNIATETYIKEALMNLFQRVSSNGPGYIKTAEYRRKVDREEDKIAKGELGKTAGGLLPVEYEEMKKRKPLCMEDLRLALVLGDSYLGQVPLMAGSINMDRHLDAYGIDEIYPEANPATYNSKTGFLMERTASGGVVNGVNGVHAAGKEVNGTNGWVVELNDLPAEGYGEVWQGAEVEDMSALDDTLDNILGGLVT